MRRRLLALTSLVLVAALVATGLLIASPARAQEPRTLTVSTWGFNQDLLDKNITRPFEELYNVTIVYETGNNSERLSKLLERGDNPGVDVVHLAGSYTYQAMQAGLLQPYDPELIPSLGELYDWAQDPLGGQYAVGYSVSSYGLFYNTDEVSEPITSWRDLWRDDVSGYVTVPDMSTTNGPATLVLMARAFGGGLDNVEPAWEHLPSLVDRLVTSYIRSSELITLVQEGEAWVGSYPSFSWGSLVATGQPLAPVIPEEGLAGFQSMVSVVKNTPNADLANAYIDFILSHDVQYAEAMDLVNSPTNTTVELPDDVASQLTYGADIIDNLIFIDEAFAADHQEEWINRWNAIIAGQPDPGPSEAMTPAASYEGRTLTVSTWGFNQDLLDKNITFPFEELYGVTVVYETGNNSERLSKLLERGDNPGVDVAHFAGSYTYTAMQEGILEPYDPALLPHLGELYDWAQDPLGGQYAIGYSVSSYGLFYNTDEVSEPITSWRDLWRDDVAGFVTVPDMGTTNGPATLVMMARAWGGGLDNVEPAWEHLPDLVPNLVTTYIRSSELITLAQEGEAWVGAYPSFSWGSLIETGQPLAPVIPEEGLAGFQSLVSVVKGTPNADLAHLYIDFIISHDVQLAEAMDLVELAHQHHGRAARRRRRTAHLRPGDRGQPDLHRRSLRRRTPGRVDQPLERDHRPVTSLALPRGQGQP